MKDKIARAKQVKIEDLYPYDLKQYGQLLRGVCPFHADSGNPNFTIYTKTNSWYCFVCQKGGDVIAYFQRLYDLDFKEAVNGLVD